jgi:hypothetical protein
MSTGKTEIQTTEWAVYATKEGAEEFQAASGLQRYETVEGWLKALQAAPGFKSARVTERTVTTIVGAERSVTRIEAAGTE